MDAKAAGATAAVLTGIAAIVAISLPPLATVEVSAGPIYLLGLSDGGNGGYIGEYRQSDGGTRWMRTANPPCVRRKLGGSSLLCRRGPNTLSHEVVGELNRFPEAEAQPLVNDCEPVACAVWYGEDSNVDEATLLGSVLGGVLP
jgi:hypothetical protein